MVSESGKIKSRPVHQRYHRIGIGVYVISRIARAVVACRKKQQIGVHRPHAVDKGDKPGKAVYGSVHVVYGKDGNLFGLRKYRNRDNDSRTCCQ
jgi:hypothetical protein